jgi:hypothetical protein
VAEEVVWRGLDDVPHVLPLRNIDGQGDGEHVDEFWSKIGYPTAASRSWERKTAAATSGGQRARSSSPTRTVKPAGGGRPASSSPPVFRLPKLPVKMKAWKGPLPPRRITPPAVSADFVDVARVVSAARAAVDGLGMPRHAISVTAEASTAPASRTSIPASFRPRFDLPEAIEALRRPPRP